MIKHAEAGGKAQAAPYLSTDKKKERLDYFLSSSRASSRQPLNPPFNHNDNPFFEICYFTAYGGFF